MSERLVTRAVILARGLGTRMRRADQEAELDAEQAAVADLGLKAMIPVGRPFLDYVLSGLADAGFTHACLVIGPEHDQVRDYYTREERPERITVEFAIQAEPLGTADAVLAAADCTGDEPFVVMNSDNYYPVEALRALRLQGAPALLGFDRKALVSQANIDPDRIAKFALLEMDDDGALRRIVEKPDEAVLQAMGPHAPVSMNCWCFSAEIFEACRAIEPSERGELEIPLAVQYAIERMGMRFAVVESRSGVLDLSSRGDIAAVKERLAGIEVHL